MTNNNTLVIDDNETLLRSLAEFLRCLDSSARARTNQERTDAAVDRVSFVLTCHKREIHDCSSLELLEAISASRRESREIAVCSYTISENLDDESKRKLKTVLPNPLPLSDLRHAIARLDVGEQERVRSHV